ncbi:Bestrophin, RFP-TM, chloride channel-domain-containing protein [Dipodascopsis tothii]|uniref:Bestrophin, RFP-TM, chloride channel-domain-containing protein n=1 Tax=Dipodascopsis tothii TaxID=44089 RepID=UPI0034CEAF8E
MDFREKLQASLQQWIPQDPRLHEYLVDRDDRIARATIIHGNLPLEILQFISYYCRELQHGHQLLSPAETSFFYAQTNSLTEILTGTERILRTPLPLAYNILCSQLAWIFVLALPFQLVSTISWVAIPATLIAAYVILGLAAIGLQIENPFGFDVNDLDLDRYCQMVGVEIALVMSHSPVRSGLSADGWMKDPENRPLAPVFDATWQDCLDQLSLDDIFHVLQQTVEDPAITFTAAPFIDPAPSLLSPIDAEERVLPRIITTATRPRRSSNASVKSATTVYTARDSKPDPDPRPDVPKMVFNTSTIFEDAEETDDTLSPSRKVAPAESLSPGTSPARSPPPDELELAPAALAVDGPLSPASTTASGASGASAPTSPAQTATPATFDENNEFVVPRRA